MFGSVPPDDAGIRERNTGDGSNLYLVITIDT
jgi:hypothetical protein